MLKVKCPISGFFQLVLGIFPKFTPNTIHKSLGTSKIFFQKCFKIKLYNRSDTFMMGLVLSSAEVDSVIKK